MSPAAPVLDRGAVREVLVARAGERVAISVLGDTAYAAPFALPEQLEDAVEWVRQRATPERTVSVGVATLSAEGAERLEESRRRGVRARPRHGEHTGYAWVAADLDPHDGEDLVVLHDRLRRYPHPPTLLSCSGRGLHAWWHLAEPVDVDEGRRLCEDLARALGGDPGAADEGRALRLPGTYNGKPGVERLAVVLERDLSRRYPAEQLTAAALALAPRPTPPAPRPRRVLELREGLDVAEQLRDGHDLADELDRIAGPRNRQHKWRCPGGHDETASLGLHRDDRQRWVCFGGGHGDGFGRRANGVHSGDVVDLLALEAGLTVERFLSAERARLAPVHLTPADPVTGTADARRSSDMSANAPHDEDIPLPPEPPAEAEPSPAPPRGGKGGGKKAEQPSQADQLVELALRDYELGRSKTDPYAVPLNGPRVALALRGAGGSLRQHLSVAFREAHGKVPTSGALADALNTLEGYAQQVDPVDIDLRVTTLEQDLKGRPRQLVLDLGDASGRVVILGPNGWHVTAESPVVLRRTGLTLPLPEPARGASLDELRELLNVTDETWPLLMGWLVAAVLPDMPHPIALLSGEQGTGKSTAGRLLVELLDPSGVALRSSPKDEENWAVSAASSYVVGIDNISTISAWWSDAMCRAVTGDGMVRRRLYTDNDVSVLKIRRVLLLTSIDVGVLRGDLAERLLTVELERIDAKHRRTDHELEEAWRAAHPRLLGALLDMVCEVLRVLPQADEELVEKPRMADFAVVLGAVDIVTGGKSLDVYLRASERLAQDVADSDSVAHAVLEFLRGQGHGFRGSASELLGELRRYAPDPLPRDWPPDATRLSGRLKRAQRALEASGVDIERRAGRAREVILTWHGDQLEVQP